MYERMTIQADRDVLVAIGIDLRRRAAWLGEQVRVRSDELAGAIVDRYPPRRHLRGGRRGRR